MNDTPNPDVTFITAASLRQRVEDAYSNLGALAVSMKSMAFLSGVLSVCDEVAAISEAAQFAKFEDHRLPEPPQRLDPHTLAYVIRHLRVCAMKAAEGTTMMEQQPDGAVDVGPMVADGPPPGTKLS